MVALLDACQLPGTEGLKVGSGDDAASGAEKTTCTGSVPFTSCVPVAGVADSTWSGGGGGAVGFGLWLAECVAAGVLAAGVDSAAAEWAGPALPKVSASTTPATRTTPIAAASRVTLVFEANNLQLPRLPRLVRTRSRLVLGRTWRAR
jgi:hypothetical protein